MSEYSLQNSTSRGWWKEWEFWCLLALVSLFFFLQVTSISIRGEESRRGRIAWEMVNTGDWIVPRIQGEPVFFRPPMQNWMIALVGLCRGEVDAWAVRLPSQLAILGMVVLLYGYCRTFLTRTGAFACGVVFATFGQVLELGRLGETESVFTFFLAGALLTWRWCINARVSWWTTWGLSYGMAALATLTKGPQAPLYFAGSTWIFLVLSREWKRLFSAAHLFGIITALGIVALWQVPYAQQMGWETSFRVYFGDVGPRFNSMSWRSVGAHMASFPLELLCGSLLPWSLCLLAYGSKTFRASLGRAGSEAFYLATCVAVTFPSVWITPGASLRYYMPLFPCFAGLVGIVLERGVFSAATEVWKARFQRFLKLMTPVVIVAPLMTMGLALFLPRSPWAPSPVMGLLYLALGVACGVGLWWGSEQRDSRHALAGILALGCFLGLTPGTVLTNVRNHMSEDARTAILELREKLPPEEPLVSLGPMHHLFLFHLGRPVPRLTQEIETPAKFPNTDYFCVWVKGEAEPKLSFAWERLAKISCDRNRHSKATEVIFVGRRLHDQVAQQSD